MFPVFINKIERRGVRKRSDPDGIGMGLQPLRFLRGQFDRAEFLLVHEVQGDACHQ